ncbi:PAS domain S-box protein [Thermodesulfobacteriota bacterium]
MTQGKILIVEDEVMLAKELARGLKKSGYEVVGNVSTGEEAVQKAEEKLPDLILMDITLEGEMDGIETANQIRSSLDTAIIYLTAHTATDVFDRAKITEPYAYLTKPVSPQELGRTVEMALYKRQMDKKLRESEKALAESEEELRLTLEATTDGIWKWTFRTNDLVFSPNYYTMLGYAPDEFPATYESWVDLIHPEDLSRALDVAENYLQTKPDLYENLFRLRTKSGDYRWIRAIARVVERDGQGEALRMIGNHEDITDRKNAEKNLTDSVQELQRSNKEVQSLLECSRGVLNHPDFPTAARIVFDECCKATGATSGYVALLSEDGSENELLFLESGGLPCSVDPHLPMPIRGLRGEAYREGQVVYDNDFSKSRWMEFMPEGHVELENVLFAPLIIDAKTVGLLGLANKPDGFNDRDARLAGAFGEFAVLGLSRTKASEALKRSEERFRLAMEASNDGLWDWNVQTGEVYRSPAFYEMLGYQPEEFPSGFDGWKSLVHPEDAPLVLRNLNCYLSGESPEYEVEFHIITKSGDPKWVLSRGKVVGRDNDGNPLRMIGTHADITGRKHSEQSLKRYSMILEAQNQAHKGFLEEIDQHRLFDELLKSILRLTDSEYGYIGEVFSTKEGEKYQLSRAISNIAWTPELKKYYEKNWRDGLRFEGDDTLQGQVISTGKPIISNDPAHDSRSKGVPQGHPPIDAFMGLPVYKGSTLVGTVGVANRPGGYDEEIVEYLEPYLATCSSILSAFKSARAKESAERALRESEELHRHTIENISDAIFVTDETGAFTYVCPNTDVIFGYSSEEVESMGSIQKILGTNLVDPEELAEGKEVRNIERRIVQRSGDEKFLLVNMKSVIIGKGRILYTCRDITERVRSEQSLRQSEEKFSKAFQDSPVMITLSKIDDGTYFEVNEAFTRVSGFSSEEAVGRTSIELGWIHQQYRERILAELVNHGEVRDLELELYAKDGRVIRAVYSGDVIEVGEAQMLLSIAHDVTRRKEAEQALEASKEKILAQRDLLNAVFETAPFLMIVVNQDGHIEEINRAGETLGAMGIEEALGLLRRDALPCFNCCEGLECSNNLDPRNCAIRTGVMHTLATGESTFDEEGQLTVRRESGDESLTFLVSTSLLSRELHGKKVLVTIVDITEKRRAEELQESLKSQLLQAQKMESIGTLAGGIAHDFNNLLQVVLGYSEMLVSSKKKDDPDQVLLAPIKEAAQDGGELVKGLMTFSRRVEPNLRPLNINQLLQRTRRMLRRLIPKMIKIEFSLAEDVAPIQGDPSQIEQIIFNLAVNAHHAMEKGGTLTFETSNLSVDEQAVKDGEQAFRPGRYVALIVSDNGKGMTDEVKARIFEPFFSTKEPGQGTGLGLAMVYGIVKSHGGYISCESQSGIGTKFEILFPEIGADNKPEKYHHEESPLPGNETILLVDDEERVRELGRLILSQAGYQVLTASNGVEALALFRKEMDRLDLILLDLVMPEMGGIDCLRELVGIEPTTKVLVLSGQLVTPDDAAVIKGLAKGFVRKPFTVASLLSEVRKALDECASEQQSAPEE